MSILASYNLNEEIKKFTFKNKVYYLLFLYKVK